ncbi:T6SS immunity protein Tli4 family protein [Massilia sp. DWR3-1-1]|uniref:T6SS immunity protein Tli4 family protein n=1 Tax=Massilia sp. DWR3-1-1 TaxID=2804559 RepID=UPI003CE6D31D
MPEFVPLSSRLKKLFTDTKLVCFGRYAISVPREARIISGSYGFPSYVTSFPGNYDAMMNEVTKDIQKIKFSDQDAIITYNKSGPIDFSWQIRYFDSEAAKDLRLLCFKTYINIENISFNIGNAVNPSQSEVKTAEIEFHRAKSLRLRSDDDVPHDDGYCIENAFMASSFYGDQETVSAGIFLPSLPDVIFSISSNKDAYSDYSKIEFEKMKGTELSLLGRIRMAQEQQGTSYPNRIVLREGKRDVQHWKGEESLIKRQNGVHDFEWGFVGTPKDVANPSEFIVGMFTKVEHNVVGSAKESSLSDDEAIALWDKLLAGLKFRVKVPGAPEGSYFLPQSKPNKPDTK